MKERNWKYKITGNWFGPMVIAITTAVSGGFTFWLYTAHDGAFVGLGGLTAFFAIICVLSAYGAMSFKLLVDKDGFYFRTKPGNGAVLPLQRDLQHVAQLRQRDGHTGSNLLQL